MLLKPCPRCKKMMPVGPAYCKDCAPIAQAELEAIRTENLKRKARRYNRQRDPKYLTFYRSKEWRTLSRAFLQAVYRDSPDKLKSCQAKLNGCQGLAVEVHHIVPIQTPEGWERRLDWSNLEAVCTNCHNGRHPEKLRKKNEPGVIDLSKVKL